MMKKILGKLLPPATSGCPVCDMRKNAMLGLHDKLESSRKAQSNQSKRLEAFRREHPEMWRLYFTKAGDAERGIAT